MAAKESPTLRVLREIRDELKTANTRLEGVEDQVKATNGRLDSANTRLEGVENHAKGANGRLDSVNMRLERVEHQLGAVEKRQAESEMRLATELVAVAHAVGEVRDLLRERLEDRGRLDDHERRIASIETRRS